METSYFYEVKKVTFDGKQITSKECVKAFDDLISAMNYLYTCHTECIDKQIIYYELERYKPQIRDIYTFDRVISNSLFDVVTKLSAKKIYKIVVCYVLNDKVLDKKFITPFNNLENALMYFNNLKTTANEDGSKFVYQLISCYEDGTCCEVLATSDRTKRLQSDGKEENL